MERESAEKDIFMPADILLPSCCEMEKWSVIACDQFSSEREYWERAAGFTGAAPSTLNLVLPEVYLGGPVTERIKKIHDAMEEYSSGGILGEIGDSFIYIERTLQGGGLRRGLVGVVDLEEYEFSGKKAAILAREGTAPERLPVRIDIRRGATLELPHIMAFIDDIDETVIEPLTEKAAELPLLYDFDMMEGGGHIRGMRVSGKDAGGVMNALRALRSKNSTLLVIGDGNHALAAAKAWWDELKQGLSGTDRQNHPARKALLEINNVYERSIVFEAIHRVVFGADAEDFAGALRKAAPEGDDYFFEWFSSGSSGAVGVSASCIGDALTSVRDFLDDYITSNGCALDYIHGDETVKRLSQADGAVGLLFPAMDKRELFATVTSKGVFPKKSFSVGRAVDKRYYLECRRIR